MSVEYTNGKNTLVINEKEAVIINSKNSAFSIETDEIKRVILHQNLNQTISGRGDIKIIGTEYNIILHDTEEAVRKTREIKDFYAKLKKSEEGKTKPEEKPETKQIIKTEQKPLTEQEKFYKRANTAQEIGVISVITIIGVIALVTIGFIIFILIFIYLIILSN